MKQHSHYLLTSNEWKTGETIWLLALVGPPKALPAIRKQLDKEVFKGRPVHLGFLAEADVGVVARTP
jgi:hemolysin-activating ACP:hemolysin acyltransferase